MATKKTTKGSAPVGLANGNGSAAIPSDGMVQGDAYNPIHQVDNLKDFHKEAERLRDEGYTEVPGFLGGGRGGKLGIDYADYINANLACDATAGAAGKGQLPLLHVSRPRTATRVRTSRGVPATDCPTSSRCCARCRHTPLPR